MKHQLDRIIYFRWLTSNIIAGMLFVILWPSMPMAGENTQVSASLTASEEEVLIHYWNFNDIPNNTDFSTTHPELLDVTSRHYGAFLSYNGDRWDRVNDPTPLNNREELYDEEDDRALRLRNPAGSFTLSLPTTGYTDIVLRYAATRTSNGAQEQEVAYSVNGGSSWTTAGLQEASFTIDEDEYKLIELDFSAMAAVNDNPDFQVKITLAGEGAEPENDDGNQRLNHITLDGRMIPKSLDSELIHHWNFNDIPNDVNFPTGVEIGAGGILGGNSTISGAWLRYDGDTWDRVNAPTSFNAREIPYDEDEDRALRLRNPSGDFLLRLPTTGFKDIVVRYVVKRTSSGAAGQELAYTTDGLFFQTDDLPYSSVIVGEKYIQHVLDFSDIEEVNDNPDFTLRIIPSGIGSEPDNFDGNQRFNHITVDALSLAVSNSDEDARVLPNQLKLNQNYPNPFNPSTQVTFTLPVSMQVKIDVLDVTGRFLFNLKKEKMPVGEHTVTIQMDDFSSGVYFYRLQAGEKMITRPMMLVK